MDRPSQPELNQPTVGGTTGSPVALKHRVNQVELAAAALSSGGRHNSAVCIHSPAAAASNVGAEPAAVRQQRRRRCGLTTVCQSCHAARATCRVALERRVV